MSDVENNTPKQLSAAAQRALAEAQERRDAQAAREKDLEEASEKERGGPRAEPTRFEDWERDGRAIDF